MSLLSIRSINPDSQLSAALAIYFARLALPVWQQKYPEDSRPEKAIEVAEKVLLADAARSAARSAAYAARSAYAAADAADAAYAARSAALAARSAANAADAADAADAAAYAAAAAAANAAAFASAALGKVQESFLQHHLVQLLPIILWHKLTSKRSFAEPEKVFELLPEDCREDFLFNLDSLR